MLKHLNPSGLDQLLNQLATAFRLQVPQLLQDGTRQLATYGNGELSLSGRRIQRKPTEFFFPQTEPMAVLNPTGTGQLPPAPEKPWALFGLDRADLAGLAFLDRFFMASPTDDLYLRRRKGALLIGLTGAAGPDHDFLPLSTGNCDIELVAIRGSWLALGHSSAGKKLLQDYPAGDPERLASLRKFSDSIPDSATVLQQASRLLIEDKIPDDFWNEIAARCILCSGCNLVCPTCNCFCLQDRKTATGTERSRVWDSCQLDAFMREASGHNPLGTEALRTRRRIHHKLAADVERWGEPGCVACGRCDRACPTGIGLFAVVEEMVKRYGD